LFHPAGLLPRGRLEAARLLVPGDEVRVLNDHALDARQRLQDPASFPAVLTREDQHRVSLPDVQLEQARLVPRLRHAHYSTSGASEMIFMNCRSRSSRATGPKMRVPRGSPAGVMTTAAFSSKRSTEPSGRRIGLCVRTTTARTTSPFFTPAPGVADFTAPMNTSPTSAVWLEPLSTRMQRISRAPELSATFRRLYGCIILSRPFHDPAHAPALLAR